MRLPAGPDRRDRGDDDRAAATRGRRSCRPRLRPSTTTSRSRSTGGRCGRGSRRCSSCSAPASAAGSSTPQISNKLNSTKPVAVELYLNLTESAARAEDQGRRLRAGRQPPREPDDAVRARLQAGPDRGPAAAEGQRRDDLGLDGLPKAQVPICPARASTDAVAALTQRGAEGDAARRAVEPGGGDRPRAGSAGRDEVPVGQTVRLNVSKGPQPVAVPTCVEPADRPGELDAAGARLPGRPDATSSPTSRRTP